MIFPEIDRKVSAACRRQNEQGVDDKDAHPFDRQHDNERDQYRKQVFLQRCRYVAARRQCPVHADRV